MSKEELEQLSKDLIQKVEFHTKFLTASMEGGDSGQIYKHLGKICQYAELMAHKGRDYYDALNKELEDE